MQVCLPSRTHACPLSPMAAQEGMSPQGSQEPSGTSLRSREEGKALAGEDPWEQRWGQKEET